MPRGNPDLKLNNTPWPRERTERLRRMFTQGLTDRQIAAELGVSVRSVIGKRLRLGLMRWSRYDDDPLKAALRRRQREEE